MLFSFNFNKKDRLFYSYLITYLVIISITLSMTIIGYVTTLKTLEKEMVTSNNYLLSQVTTNLDQQVQQIHQMGISLADMPDLKTVAYKYFLSGSDLLKIKDFSLTLSNHKNSTPIIDDIILYFHENDNIVTSTKRFNPKLRTLFIKDHFPLDMNFDTLVTFESYNDLIITYSQDGEPYLVFRQNIFGDDYKSQLATILILVPWKQLSQTLPKLEEGDVFLINADTQLLQYPGQLESLLQLEYENLFTDDGINYLSLDGQDMVIFHANSDLNHIKYGLAYKKSDFYSRLRYIQAMIVIQVIIGLGLALYLAFFYTKKVYKPIGKLMHVFKKHTNLSSDDVTLGKIGDDLEVLYTENTNLNSLYNTAVRELDLQQFSGYLKGWTDDIDQVKTILKEVMGLREHDPFILLSVMYNDLEESKLFIETSKVSDQNAYELLHYVFKNVFTEQVLSQYEGIITTMDGQEICLISLKATACEDHFIERLKEMQLWFKESMNLTMYIAGSAIHMDMINLRKAYNEASHVLSHQLFWSDKSDSLMFYDEDYSERNRNGQDSLRFLEYEKLLYNQLSIHKVQEARNLLHTILDEHFDSDLTSTAINRSRIFSLMNVLYSYLEDNMSQVNDPLKQNYNITQHKLYSCSIDEAKELLESFMLTSMTAVKNITDSETPSWLADMISFIDEHYTDINLNVAMVADAFHMNVAYVGRTFKKHMGESVLDYIHKRRIQTIKQWLTSNASLSDIAPNVGYSEAKTLIRVFKKYEGITPGQYREC